MVRTAADDLQHYKVIEIFASAVVEIALLQNGHIISRLNLDNSSYTHEIHNKGR